MTKQKIMDKIEEITDSNYSKFKGTNEAELHSRFEIADWILEQCQSDTKPIDLEELRKEFKIQFTHEYMPNDIKLRVESTFDWFIPLIQKQNESDAVEFTEWTNDLLNCEYYPTYTNDKCNGWVNRNDSVDFKTTQELYKEFLKTKI